MMEDETSLRVLTESQNIVCECLVPISTLQNYKAVTPPSLVQSKYKINCTRTGGGVGLELCIDKNDAKHTQAG